MLSLGSLVFGQQYAVSRSIDVKQYGAVGDGITDDRPAIQNAMNAAIQGGIPAVYFGPGVYLLSSATSPNGQLAISNWSRSINLDLVGNKATLRTQQAGSAILFAEGYWQNSTVQGLTFENTHPVTTTTTGAIVFSGGGQNAIRSWTISGNTFRNFSRHISVSGVTGLKISNNAFSMTAGRDSGTGLNTEPNVGVWMFNNTPNGTAADIQITGNQYNGCASGDVASTVSRRCGDGFVYGTGSSVVVENNVIQGFSFEGIYLFRGQATDVPPVIQANSLDGTIIKGDVSGGGQWGIRCDADGARVSRNTVTNALNGIVIYGADLPADVQNSTIANNTIVTTAGNTQAIVTGIGITGASNITVTGNTVGFGSMRSTSGEISLIFLNGLVNRFSSGLTVTNNNLLSSLPAASASTGVFIQFTGGWNIAGNTIQKTSIGFHLMNLSGSASTLTTLTSQNKLQNNVQNVVVTNGLFQ